MQRDNDQHSAASEPAFAPRLYAPLWLRELARASDGLQTRLERAEGAALFTDLAGFSRLTERFYAEGPEGAERLAAAGAAYFGRMTAIAEAWGGDVLDFIGDAVIVAWRGPVAETSRAAAGCALAMQAAMPAVNARAGVALSQRIAISAGELALNVLAAGPRTYWLLAGAPVREVGDRYHDVEPGEVLVCASAAQALGGDALGLALGDGRVRLAALRGGPVEAPRAEAGDDAPDASDPVDATDDEALRPLLPQPLVDQVQAGLWPYPGEFRRAVVLFVGLTGVAAETPEQLPALQAATRAVHGAMQRTGGSVLHLAIDDKGISLQCAYGLPGCAHEDDARRAVDAAMEIEQQLAALGLPVAIGVTAGRLFYGDGGGRRRRKLGVVGSPANLAARLMSAGLAGVICDERVRAAAEASHRFAELAAIRVKGESAPVAVFRAEGRRGDLAQAVPAARDGSVGRRQERAALARQLDRLHDGEGGFVVLVGEAGIGKSTLIGDALAQARHADIRLLLGAGSAMDAGTPYFPWRRVVSGLLERFGSTPEQQRDALLQRFASEPRLQSWLPLLAEIVPLPLPGNDTTAQMDGGARAMSLHAVVARLIAETAQDQPLALVFDDLHWFDEASAALLRAVIATPRLLVLAGTRPVDDGAIATLLGDSTLQLPLTALEPQELEQLGCRKLGVGSLPAALVEFVHRRSGGNPFYSEEVLLALRDAGLIELREGECRLAPDFDQRGATAMPNTLHGVIVSRLDKLGPRPQSLLKLASVIGGDIDLGMLGALSGNGAATLQDSLAALNAADLIRPGEARGQASDGAMRFKHAILRDVVYDLMPYAQRRELHFKVARWIEQSAAERLDPHCAELALHWERAGNAEAAIGYLERAAGLALNRYANRETVAHLTRAYALVREHRLTLDAGRAAHWEAMLGDAHHEMFEYASGLRHFHRSLDRLGDRVPTQAALMGGALLGQIARQTWQRLRTPRAPDAARAALLSRRSHMHERLAENAYFDNQPLPLLYHTLASLNQAESAGAVREMVDGYAALAIGSLLAGLRGVSLSYNRRSIALADARGTAADRAYAHMVNMVYRATLADWPALEASGRIAEPIYRAIGAGVRWHQTMSLVYHADVIRGRFQQALPVIADVRAALDRSAPAQVRSWFHCSEMTVALAQGMPSPSLIATLGAVAAAPELQRADRCRSLGLIAAGLLRIGDAEAALARADDGLMLLESDVPTSWMNVDGLGGLAEVYIALADAEGGTRSAMGRAMLDRLVRCCRGLRRYAGYSPVSTAYVEVLRGRASQRLGREADARRHWLAALAAAERHGTPYYAGLALEELARLDQRFRDERLAEAATIFAAHGATVALARLRPAPADPAPALSSAA